MLKTCPACKVALPLSDYYAKGEDRTQVYSKPCFNAYCMRRWVRKKIDAVESMGGRCIDCDGIFHYSVYEFHHIDPAQKFYDWNRLRLRSPETIKAELAKCVMLCSNCHRTRHALDFEARQHI